MAYAMEATKYVNKESTVSTEMTQIKTLLENIELMKRKIIDIKFDEKIPFAIKTKKLDELRAALKQVESYTLDLMTDVMSQLEEESNDGGGA